MILIMLLRLVATPAPSPNSKSMSSREYPSEGTPLLLTPLSRIPEEDLGGSFTKIRDPSDERSSHLRVKHASKKVRLEPPSSAQLRENDKIPKKPSKIMATLQASDRLR